MILAATILVKLNTEVSDTSWENPNDKSLITPRKFSSKLSQ